MPVNEKTTRILSYIILGSIYAYALSLQVLTGTMLEFTKTGIFFMCLFFILTLGVILYNFTTALVFQIFLGLGLIILLPGLKNYTPAGNGAIHDLITRISDIYWYVRGYFPYNESYKEPLIACCCFLTALIAAIGMYSFFNFFLLSATGFAVFVIGWTLGFPRSNQAFLIFLACFIALLSRRVNSLSSDEGVFWWPKASAGSAFILRTILPAAVLTVAVSLLPNPGKDAPPANLDTLFHKPLTAISEQIYLWFNPTLFSFQSTGFSGKSGRLGGKVQLNTRQIMRVKADERLYLAGAYYDNYTGSSWQNTGTEILELDNTNSNELDTYDLDTIDVDTYGLDSYFSDYIETVSRIYDMRRRGNEIIVLNPWLKNGYTIQREITIDIGQARTSTIFQPPKTYELYFSDQEIDISINKNDALEAGEVMAKNTSYTAKYVSLNGLDDDYLESVLKGSGKTPDWDPPTQGYDYYTSLSEAETSRYLTLSDSLPTRVTALAEDLTKEIVMSSVFTSGFTGTQYHEYEKAKAIEAYLLNMPYTLSPADVPRDRDFVDYFLFDGKEGYCTYYASAMVVLCRAIGIPSRYVEGYVMPPKPSSDGYYYVTNSNAHSWAEVYLRGFGWVTFEATAPYHFSGSAANGEPVFSESMVSDPYYEQHMNDLGYEGRRQKPSSPSQTAPTAPASVAAAEFSPEFLVMFRVFVTIVVVAAYYYGIIWVYGLYRKFDNYRISRLPKDQQAEIYFTRIQKMCSYRYAYLRKHANETLTAHAERLGRRFVFRNESLCLSDIIAVIYKLRYSGSELSDDELATVRDGYSEMWEQLCMIKPRPVLVRDKWLMRV